MTHSRKLAAIMFTDIQGYTGLMQQNEKKAIQYRDKHRSVFNSITEKYQGKILQYYGDGTLSMFDSAIDAVNCAIEMQLGFQQAPTIPVRIGIHTGDVILGKEDIIGDSVNIASRIESLAVPGSVIISEKVYDEIKNQESIQAAILKTVKFKNVEKPISVYAVSNLGLIVPRADEIEGKTDTDFSRQQKEKKDPKTKNKKAIFFLIGIATVAILVFAYLNFLAKPVPSASLEEKSIAVLAFENMSGDPEQEYFSDGISEEILNSLSHVEGLKVAGRTSAFSFKGKHEDIRKIGEKLGVKMVLEGSVRKSGSQFRITAQLINVEDGFHLWSETYDREMEDIIAVQEDIANRIVEKLKLKEQEPSDGKSGTQNIEAYELVLKGSYFFNQGYENRPKAMEYFQKAVEIDPNYAEAHAYIGETYLHFAGLEILSTADAYSKARTAAQRSIFINQFNPRAHKVLAYIHLFFDWDWEATTSEYNKALSYGLSEQNEFITYYYIFVKKDYEHAIYVSKQILETDPLHVDSHWQLGLCYHFASRYEEALISFNNALELDPNFFEGYHWKGIVLGYLGQFEAALNALEKAWSYMQNQNQPNFDLLVVKIQMGKKNEVLESLDPEAFFDPVNPAMLYTLLGMPDEAIFWLEKGYRQRSLMMVSIKHFPIWDPLRDDPRFIEIHKKMNFSE